jgi:hypothetical protein
MVECESGDPGPLATLLATLLGGLLVAGGVPLLSLLLPLLLSSSAYKPPLPTLTTNGGNTMFCWISW